MLRYLMFLLLISCAMIGCDRSAVAPSSESSKLKVVGQGTSLSTIVGELKVVYTIITYKSEGTERSSGDSVSATRVDFYQDYVLVHSKRDVRLLKIVDLKNFVINGVSRHPNGSHDEGQH